MKTQKQRWIDGIVIIVAAIILSCALGPIVLALLFLMLDVRTSQQLAESLQKTHPTLEIKGTAGIERHISIWVRGQADEKVQKGIMDWLEEQKEKRGLVHHVGLSFQHEGRSTYWQFDPTIQRWKSEN